MTRKQFIGLTMGLLLSGASAHGAIQLAPQFGEHMVLQQGVPFAIWGGGCPGGDTVKVSIAGQSVTATSDWDGQWIVHFAPIKAGGPYQMLIEVGGYGPIIPNPAATTKGGAELNDVLVGEIVLASSLAQRVESTAASGGPGDVAHPYAWVRVYGAGVNARWGVVSASAAASGRDQVLALARELYNKLQVPIGVVDTLP
jgi:sialate O-acetylesterase